jgi:hypothetical protein
VAAQIRYVLINDRGLRTVETCALCSLKIENEYVRALQTGLIYCDAQCFVGHEMLTALTFKPDARKVS